MQEHEVPTHVQAEDRVLLWFTFPQIVALTAVAALAYGAFRFAPFGPSEVRLALAVLLGLAGAAAVVGRIGGRRLPLVASDLLRFWLGPRRYAGAPAELARNAPPPPPPATPNPLQLLAKRTRRGLRKARKRRRRGRKPFRPHCRFGKRFSQGRGKREGAPRVDIRSIGRRGGYVLLAASVTATTVLGVMALAAQPAAADGHEFWFGDDLFEGEPEPVPGRRLFVERLSVSGDVATLSLRAATALDIEVRAYGGPDGRTLAFLRSASHAAGERIAYDLPLGGDAPSITISWRDELGEAGALSFDGEKIPWPLPSAVGELCRISVSSLTWTPGRIDGVVASECTDTVEERVTLPVASGHHEAAVTALVEASVDDLSGTLTVSVGEHVTSATLAPGAGATFRLAIGGEASLHALAIEVALEATVTAPAPPLFELTHHPERVERRVETVTVTRPGFSQTVSETVLIPNEDETFTEHTVTVHFFIPEETILQDVVLTTVHPVHVRAEVVPRAPIVLTRRESLALALSVASDDLYEPLAAPEREEAPPPATQTIVPPEMLQWLLGIIEGR